MVDVVEREYEQYCPVCGEQLPGEEPEYEICKNCGWQDDPTCDDDPDWDSGMNSGVTIVQAIENYQKTGRAVPKR